LFPEGLTYDSEIEHYRTTRVNSAFAVIPRLSMVSESQNKNTPAIFAEVSSSVVQANQISNQELEELKKLAIIKRQIQK